jgi:hypothetical protein
VARAAAALAGAPSRSATTAGADSQVVDHHDRQAGVKGIGGKPGTNDGIDGAKAEVLPL